MKYSITCLIGFLIVFVMTKQNIKILYQIRQKFTKKQKYIIFTLFVLIFAGLMTLLMSNNGNREVPRAYIGNVLQLLMIPLLLKFYEDYKIKKAKSKEDSQSALCGFVKKESRFGVSKIKSNIKGAVIGKAKSEKT